MFWNRKNETKLWKKSIKAILILVCFFTLICVGLHFWAKHYIKNILTEKLPSHLTLTYSDLEVNLLKSSVFIHNSSLKIKTINKPQNCNTLKLKTLQLEGINYSDLLFNETLSIEKIVLKSPNFNYYPDKKPNKLKTKTNNKGIKVINFKQLNITNGNINVMKQGRDSIKASVASYNLNVWDGQINLQSKEQIPATYKNYNLVAKEIILGNNDYETIKIDHLNSNKEVSQIENLKIIPKYNKTELSKHLNKERDYINLSIPKITLKDLDFNKNSFGVAITSAEIVSPYLEIYRDKLLPDDLTFKPLYSKSLRELNFNLTINKTTIKNGYVSYAELVNAENPAGKVFFNNIYATINNITNQKKAKQTEVKIQSKLMGYSPLKLNCIFDVNNKYDLFKISGSVNSLPAEILNPLLEPNLKLQTEGKIQEIYFSFNGTNIKSEGELKMRYEDFKIKILRKKNFKINRILTAIGNIFVKNDSKATGDEFTYGEIKAKREVNKSFFNYLWINVKSGIVHVLTGISEK